MPRIPIFPNAVHIECEHPPLSSLNDMQKDYIQPLFISNTTYYQGMHDEYICQLVTASRADSITLTNTFKRMLPELQGKIYPMKNGQLILNNG